MPNYVKNIVKVQKDIIAAHNQLIGVIRNAEMTHNRFQSAQIWRKIACEGAAITNVARAFGIDATVVDTSSGVILVKENMPLNEIIASLENQAQDRDDFIDENDPDCVFRHDAAALRAAANLLRELEA